MTQWDDDHLPDHLFRLFEQAGRRFREEVAAVVAEESITFPVSGSRLRVLELIPPGGIRPTELAARARITKQSLGEMLDALEGHGLVRRRPDPADGRAWLVRATPKGRALCAEVDRVAAAAEARLAARFGPPQYRSFRDVLSSLALDG